MEYICCHVKYKAIHHTSMFSMPIIEIFQVIREWVTSKAPGNPCEQFSDIRKLGSNLWKKVMIDFFDAF